MEYKFFIFLKARLTIIIYSGLAMLFWPSVAFTQKYSFTNYSIEDGLLQSQVTKILQDNTHQLVITTYLGINRFDGKTFTPVTKDNNLTDIFGAVTVDHTGKIWCSNPKGLYYFYADKTNRFISDSQDSSIKATQLNADKSDNIWGLGKRLFKITGNHVEYINVTGKKDSITAITTDKDGQILAAVVNKGIFRLQNNQWISLTPFMFPKGIHIQQFIVGNDGAIYVSTGTDILFIKNNVVKRLSIDFKKNGTGTIYCIALDNSNGLWIATNKGAYYYNNKNLKYFNGSNGFTDNAVYAIFKDYDNDIWFGTNGSGIFRFDGDAFLIFNQAQCLDESILFMAKDKDNNILMSGGSKLIEYNGKQIIPLKIPLLDSTNNPFHCLYTDKEQNTWIVTQKELLEKNGSGYTRFYPRNKNDARLSLNFILEDQNKTMWLAASDGCYYWNNGFKKISGVNFECTGLVETGLDSMIVGSRNGIFLVKDKKIDQTFKAGFLKGSVIMCMKYYKGRIYVGTLDNGLFIWNPQGGPVTHLNEKNGLSSVSVYSVDVDKNDVLWVGTGHAVNQFKIIHDGKLLKIINENISNLVFECNQGALLFYNAQIWLGTTKGMYVFKNNLTPNSFNAPYTIIQDVLFYNKQYVKYTFKSGYKEPQNLKLPFNSSHITMGFNSVYLKNPHNVSYSYKLWPLDTRFSPRVINNVVDYPSLPPGNYVFYVKSYTLAGVASNVASFSFEVTPAYYQTMLFKLAIGVMLFLICLTIWKYLKVKEEQKRKLIAQLRLEEQVKIRKQTAEDFHDDLGNKLTRINVLSDILYKKVDTGLQDQRKLIVQIKENADALFTGSKHILWALDPDNDRLSEVLIHLKEFGIDLFLNTTIRFTSNLTDDLFKNVTLPMGYGRNITLIFKELLNNVLRHSRANNVIASAFLNEYHHICITVEDDGIGFDMNSIKYGNGMRNINNRAKKIDGSIETMSSVGKGTAVTLVIKKISHLPA